MLIEFWLANFRGPSVYMVHSLRLILNRNRSVGLICPKGKKSQEKLNVTLDKHKRKSSCI
jgi:hypothetical protein